ncbi:glycoside hydrolase family 5 protein [Ktedonobacter racemifer]|uniref:cellulase n=1 Tax=Ktedonobacter racemifer DSM 44963 TaxID=485913 RepID=D6TQ91_KTERA|nr:cellulase family glycosylhydrolase [Ktedonobacter racemifer]EFH85739.1 glycoside hydrolase family 5 [Ktedonobacter racemifer DSM 44963]
MFIGRTKRAWLLLLILVLILASLVATIRLTAHSEAVFSSPATPTVSKHRLSPIPSYSVEGRMIFDNQGKLYVPYGVHSTALFQPDWRHSLDYKNFTRDQIKAARTFWHSNVITFQISRENLFPDRQHPTTLDGDYLAAMDRAVSWTTQEHMNVIFNLQTEASSNEMMATPADMTFWWVVAGRYKENQKVFFDIFNEPRNFYDWNLWQNGGVRDGVQYVGMQQLVDAIRQTGAQNLILAQGQGAGESFDYDNFRDHLLKGANIVYAIHPYLNNTQHATRDDWESWWGLSVRKLDVPFVIGEWNETPGSGCIANAGTVVPQFLTYVQALHIGLIAWALTPGALIRSDGAGDASWDWTNLTSFDTPTYACNDEMNYPYFDPQAQGAGQLLLQFLRTNSP